MITPQIIEEILQGIGASRQAAREISNQYISFKRNRSGAHTLFVPAPFCGMNKAIFIKEYESNNLFFRECSAIKLLAQNSRDGINTPLFPKIIYLDKDRKLIATEAIQGCPLSKLLKDTLRLDKAIFRRRSSLDSILRAIIELINCMRAIYILPTDFPNGCDHTPLSIIKRIRSKLVSLDRIKDLNKLFPIIELYLKDLENFLAKSFPKPKDLVYVHGDLSPSNIIIANDRPYLIDFEDSGYGIPGRDMAFLIHMLKSIVKNRFYLKSQVTFMIRTLTEQFESIFDVPRRLKIMWELEWYLNEIILLSTRKTNILNRPAIWEIRHCVLSIREILS